MLSFQGFRICQVFHVAILVVFPRRAAVVAAGHLADGLHRAGEPHGGAQPLLDLGFGFRSGKGFQDVQAVLDDLGERPLNAFEHLRRFFRFSG